jgi:hypothetical protein
MNCVTSVAGGGLALMLALAAAPAAWGQPVPGSEAMSCGRGD